MITHSTRRAFHAESPRCPSVVRPLYGRLDAVVLGILLLCSGALAAASLQRGWIPHDEGTLAQSAERLLQGELPHRDFDELYTGLLTYLHAAAFALFGTTLLAIRYVLAASFIAWLGVTYALARRFLAPLGSGMIVALSAAWSVPLYFAGMPSWYNLFLASASLLATFRFLEEGKILWLMVAGILGGVSFLVKLPGLYLIAATGLVILHRGDDRTDPGRRPGLALALGLVGAVLVASLPVMGHPELSVFVNLSGPILLVAWLLFVRPPDAAAPAGQQRRSVAGSTTSYLAGVILPVGLFLLFTASQGSIAPMMHGVFVLPAERLAYASQPPLGVLWSSVVILPALLVGGFLWTQRNPGARRVSVLSGALLLLLVAARPGGTTQTVVIVSLLFLPLAVVALGASVLLRHDTSPQRPGADQALAVLVVLAFHGLIQYPYAAFIYFLYVAPLALLGAAAALSLQERSNLVAPTVLGLFYLLFALFRMDGTSALPTRALGPMERMELDRSGLVVPAGQRQEYERLVEVVQARTEGPYLYAAPDSPEVYFLTGLRNPTRTLFDFMDEPAGRDERILGILEERDVEVVVVNREPSFSSPLSGILMERLVHNYPDSAMIGRFVVRWKGGQ